MFRRAAGQFVAAAALCGISGILVGPAAAENRQLSLYNTHTHERLTITYKRDGKYIKPAIRELNRFLRDWRRNEITEMDLDLIDLVWRVYQKSGSNQPIHVVSGYRSPATNNMLRRRSRGVAKSSRHMRGQAMDFFLPDVPVSKLRALGLRQHVGGVGYYPSSRTPFVHMDTGRVRHWPRMSRQQLVSVFPDGKTIHVPRDGKPLPGYATALAQRKNRKRGARVLVASSRPISPNTESATNSQPATPAAPPARATRIASTTTESKQVFAGIVPVPRENPYKQTRQPITMVAIPPTRPRIQTGDANVATLANVSLGGVDSRVDPLAATIRGLDYAGPQTDNMMAYARQTIPGVLAEMNADDRRARKPKQGVRVASLTPATMVDAVDDEVAKPVQKRPHPFAMARDPLARLESFDFRISARLLDSDAPGQASTFAPMPQDEYIQFASLLSKTEMAVDGLYGGGNSLPPSSEYIASYSVVATSGLPMPVVASLAPTGGHPLHSLAWYGLASVLMMVFGGFVWSMRRLFA